MSAKKEVITENPLRYITSATILSNNRKQQTHN